MMSLAVDPGMARFYLLVLILKRDATRRFDRNFMPGNLANDFLYSRYTEIVLLSIK